MANMIEQLESRRLMSAAQPLEQTPASEHDQIPDGGTIGTLVGAVANAWTWLTGPDPCARADRVSAAGSS